MKRLLLAFAVIASLGFVAAFAARALYVSYDPLTEKLIAEAPATHILMFGDSVLSTPAACDTDHRPIDQMVSELLDQPVLAIKHGAYSASVFEHYAALLSTNRSAVETAIIPINLAAWSRSWGDRPGYQFALLKNYIDFRATRTAGWPVLWSHLITGSDLAAKQQWDAGSSRAFTGEELGLQRDLDRGYVARTLDCSAAPPTQAEREQLRRQFLWHYGVVANEGPAIDAALRNTLRRLKASRIRPIVYLTPIDLGDARVVAGEELVRHIDAQAKGLIELIREEGVEALDLHGALAPEYFMDKRFATEHLNQAGRLFVASEVAARYRRGE